MNQVIKNISIIGTGNVAWHLGNAFARSGIEINHIAGREMEKAKQLAELLGCKSFGTLEDEIPESDLYLLAVRDDVIRTVFEKVFKKGRFIVHHAGAIKADILDMHDNKYGVIWPMQTLTKNNEIDLKETLIAVSGNSEETQAQLKELASKISSRVIEVSDEQRSVMHLSAVWINNYTNHMYDIAYNLLKENNLSLELFYPLMEEHLNKLKEMPPDQLQTGPAIRGDMATLAKHKSMMNNHKEWKELYDTLAKSILHKYINK